MDSHFRGNANIDNMGGMTTYSFQHNVCQSGVQSLLCGVQSLLCESGLAQSKLCTPDNLFVELYTTAIHKFVTPVALAGLPNPAATRYQSREGGRI